MTTIRGLAAAVVVSTAICGAAQAQSVQYPGYQQYQGSPQAYPNVQYYPYNPPPAAPPSWSYNPYTSGLGPCPQRMRGDDRCDETMMPTAGQPNYWVRCDMFAGMSGAEADDRCRQLVTRQAYEVAAAQHAAIEQQTGQQAAVQAGSLTLPASAYEPVSVDYATPSDNRRRRITVKRLNSYSEPASQRICDTFTKIDLDLDSGTSTTATARRCKGPGGEWRETL